MVDAVRTLTRQQLTRFLLEHQAVRTFERMQEMVVDLMPGEIDDLEALVSTSDARIAEAIAASNRLSEAIEALLAQPAVREVAAEADPAPLAAPLVPAGADDLAPPPLQLTAGVLTSVLGSALGANPTATVGPTATNGTATTYIRSDGAPAIDLTATYPWTGQHTFGLAGSINTPSVLLTSTQPVLGWDETDQASGEQRWVMVPVAKVLQRRSVDAGGSSIIWESVTRGTGNAISNIAWGDTTNNNTYSFSSTGNAAFTGPISTPRIVVNGATVATNGMYLPAANTVGLSANSTLSAQLTSTTFQALLQFILSGDISPAQLTANTDDWNPTGLSTASVIRVSTDASRNLTGIQGGADGRVLILINVGTQPLVLVHDSTSTAANRFFLASSTNTTVQSNGACILWYDSTSSRWRQITRIA